MSKIVVTGTIEVAAEDSAAAAEVFRRLMPPTRAEAGCEHYSFSTDLLDPGRFVLTEIWSSRAHLDDHMAAPHMAELFPALQQLGVLETRLTMWTDATEDRVL